MSSVQHKDLAAGRWNELTVLEQLGNIGSEISRAIRWRTRNAALSEGAFHRALELFDLTLDDPKLRQSGPRLREVARAREVVVDFFHGDNTYRSDPASLQRYFDAYALAARRRMGA